MHYDHRISHDIDIFVPGSDIISNLSPGRNPLTKALIAGRNHEFPGNYLKLQLESGEIDFIVGSKRTRAPAQPWQFENRTIQIDTPWETAIKKIFYRSSTFKIRDVFDLAAVIDRDGEMLEASLPEVEDRLDKLTDRIDALAPAYEAMVKDDVNPTAGGRKYMDRSAILGVLAFLKDWRKAGAS